MFEIQSVSKKFNGEFALNNVSLQIGKGFNFIVGASGSGKTTLLKIMSGMEQDFNGDVAYCGKSMKSLTAKEKSYFYNHIFGFVWQDFNLLEDHSVLENVTLPQLLKSSQNKKTAVKILKELKIYDLAAKKVKYLSGGQKQRVAIARELMKNPQVIIADEPTSALDEKTSESIMDILRTLSKSKTVIIVTHDTSLIRETDHVYELDKGELISTLKQVDGDTAELKLQNPHALNLPNAFLLANINRRDKLGRFAIAMVTLVVASVLLLTSVGGAVLGSSQSEFDQLFETYGESLTDIGIYKGFTDGAGTDGSESDKPKGDVSQDIRGLYDLYAKDERITFIAYLQAFDDITIKINGEDHSIKSSGNVPSFNKLIAGKMPMGNEHEVAVPKSFVTNLGISNEQAIGKEIDFKGSIVNWDSGSPVWKETNVKAKIVGIVDATIKDEYEGEAVEYPLDDAFFFSKTALESMVKQAGTTMEKMSFLIRAKTPTTMISIKDELSKKGIVPLGRFELVEDLVRLQNQSTQQSGSTSVVIAVLSLVMVIAIFTITGFMRAKEIAIYKVSGFTNSHICMLSFAEMLSTAITAILCMIITSPLLSMATVAMFGVKLLHGNMLFTGGLFIIIVSIIAYAVTVIICTKVQVKTALKTGDH